MGLFGDTKDEMKRELDRLIDKCNMHIRGVRACANLYELKNRHQFIWKDGIRHPGLSDNDMFQCKDISWLTSDSIFLKASEDAPALSVQEWEKRKHETPEEYEKAVREYRRALEAPLRDLRNQVYDHGFSRERICRNIQNAVMETWGRNVKDVYIHDWSIRNKHFLTVSFVSDDAVSNVDRKHSTVILTEQGDFLIRDDFADGRTFDRSGLDGHDFCNIALPGKAGRLVRKPEKLEKSNTGTLTRGQLRELTRNIRKKNAQGLKI